MQLDTWLKRNTYHHTAFTDLNDLVAQKEKQNLTISLCIPTLNEETTIGKRMISFPIVVSSFRVGMQSEIVRFC
ncbi:MAG: hypothetical protein SVR04_08560, partial [Spirochaetota bacterium]|nr:hypothetical protein [Spirochaetota bacterium]